MGNHDSDISTSGSRSSWYSLPEESPPPSSTQSQPTLSREATAALTQNLQTLGSHVRAGGEIKASHLRIGKRRTEGQTTYVLKTNNLFKRTISKMRGEAHTDELAAFISNDVQQKAQGVNRSDLEAHPELTAALQRYDQSVTRNQQKVSTPKRSRIPLNVVNSAVTPKAAKVVEVTKSGPHVDTRKDKTDETKQRRFGHVHTVRIYRGDHIDHGTEAFSIFLSTQKERFLNAVGRAFRRLGFRAASFDQYRYKQNMDSPDALIYKSDDHPMAIAEDTIRLAPTDPLPAPTSYWLGHASIMFGVTVRSASDPSRATTLRVITDPVEGDLNAFLYPRMTKIAKEMQELPAPHVYLLSHNHLDHYSHDTINKLVAQQPVMVVPKGDGHRYRELGFEHVQELDWWEGADVTFEQEGHLYNLDITAVPARHWAGQGPCGGHDATFLGYVIGHEQGDVYFAGDTARLSTEEKPTSETETQKEFRKALANMPSADTVLQTALRIEKQIDSITDPQQLSEQLALQDIAQEVYQTRRLAERLQGEANNIRKNIGSNPSSEEGKGRKALALRRAAYLDSQAELALQRAAEGEVASQISHVTALQSLFNIRYNFQPGGPDEVRKDMESTHQASVDSLWMHSKLIFEKFYRRDMAKSEFLDISSRAKTVLMHTMTFKLGNLKLMDTRDSLNKVVSKLEGEDLTTLEAIQAKKNEIDITLNHRAQRKYPEPRHAISKRQREALEKKRAAYVANHRDAVTEEATQLKSYELQVLEELVTLCETMTFVDDEGEPCHLTPPEMARLLRETVIVPKIGSNLALGTPKNDQIDRCIF